MSDAKHRPIVVLGYASALGKRGRVVHLEVCEVVMSPRTAFWHCWVCGTASGRLKHEAVIPNLRAHLDAHGFDLDAGLGTGACGAAMAGGADGADNVAPSDEDGQR